MNARFQFRLHVVVGKSLVIDPQKIALLESIAETGSISAGAKALRMSYSHDWHLVDEANRCLVKTAVEKARGGLHGGGAVLTPTGQRLIALYRALERNAYEAGAKDIIRLNRLLTR
jgi:molybdate transport system regulatory protein